MSERRDKLTDVDAIQAAFAEREPIGWRKVLRAAAPATRLHEFSWFRAGWLAARESVSLPNREAQDFNHEHPERSGVTVGEDLADQNMTLAFKLQAAEARVASLEAALKEAEAAIELYLPRIENREGSESNRKGQEPLTEYTASSSAGARRTLETIRAALDASPSR